MVISSLCAITGGNLVFHYKQKPSLLSYLFVYLPIITMDSSISVF